uniref:Uncharacterized protein n=1 Tax=Hyaloperonospora arabidopsidis (strain Emoy2) TaxID=559515 RepID=M4BPW9_HYAAE
MYRVTSEITSLCSYPLASLMVRPTWRRRKPRVSQSWLNRSRIVVTSSDRPTSRTLRLRDGVVRLIARKVIALTIGTILTVMQLCIRVICNPSTSALGVRSPMGLLRHRMRLVILHDKAQNITQKLRASLSLSAEGGYQRPRTR